MSLKRLALRNIRGNWHQYVAYFLSSVFAVTIFFIYASFIFHPDVMNGQIPGGRAVRQGIIAAEYVIVIFAFFFVLYSNSAFIKSRKREFGLYSLFGMNKYQMRWLVYLENTVISLLAIGTGIGLGILFSKLFFMGIGQLMGTGALIPFMIVGKAIIVTALGFFLLFQVNTIVALLRMGKLEIVELLKASKQPKPFPVHSRWLAATAFITLAAGYALASMMNLMTVIITMFPVLFLVVIGTYFLFTQGSVAILRRLQMRKGFYYQGTNLLTISNLVFRIKDNARMLFMVAILSAVVISASGYIFIMYTNMQDQVMDLYPQTIGYLQEGDEESSFDPAKVEAILQEDGIELEYAVHANALVFDGTVYNANQNIWKEKFLVLSTTQYNQIAEAKDLKTLEVAEGDTYLIYPSKSMEIQHIKKGDHVEGNVGPTSGSLTFQGQINNGVIPRPTGHILVLVVNDAQYEAWFKGVMPSEMVQIHGYEWKDWRHGQATVERIQATLAPEDQYRFEERITTYMEMQKTGNLIIFIGLFISILFFIATGSLIYFKLFTELGENQQQYRALYRMGVSKREMHKILKRQVGAIFFIPAFVGILHGAFAYKALNGVTGFSVWYGGLIVVGLFLLAQFIYYLLTMRTYSNAVMKAGDVR